MLKKNLEVSAVLVGINFALGSASLRAQGNVGVVENRVVVCCDIGRILLQHDQRALTEFEELVMSQSR